MSTLFYKFILSLCLSLLVTTSFAKINNLSGDFSKYSSAKSFIKKMERTHGFSRSYLNELFSQAKNHKNTLRQMNRPIKSTGVSKGSWNRYIKNRINTRKVNNAKKFIRKNRKSLKLAEQIYGVPAQYIVAIIGTETNFGGFTGKTSILSALSTLSFGKNRRAKYFQTELEAYLLMCRKEKLNPAKLKGSYAGAMGLGQFMPTNFNKYMVDFNHDGKKNMWNASDMIGSIANYFKKNGWKKNTTFSRIATAKGQKFSSVKYGWRYDYSLRKLASYGIKLKKKFNSNQYYFIKLRTYKGYKLYIAGDNFYVVTRYNNSSKYSMTIHLLAEKIKSFI